ncbi:MAG: SdrD B-like domain-containing protein, partial [Saprospiraceae bacterium]|nr:SdrD B-like domain-containing protein [Saprospiraceae bacterium]
MMHCSTFQSVSNNVKPFGIIRLATVLLVGLFPFLESTAQNPFSPALDFNIFTEQNVNITGGDVEGAIAAGGSFEIAGTGQYTATNAGTGNPYVLIGSTKYAMVVHGGIVYTSGIFQVNGTLSDHYVKFGNLGGGTATLNGSIINIQNGTPKIQVNATNQPINTLTGTGLVAFSTAMTTMRGSSTALSGCANTVTPTFSGGNPTISLNAGLNIWNITGTALNGWSGMTFNTLPSAAKTLVINVDAAGTFNWDVPNMAGIGRTEAQYIIWNFYNCTNLNIPSGAMVEGSILAPNAHIVKTSSSNVEGQIVGVSFTQCAGEVHIAEFAGNASGCSVTCDNVTSGGTIGSNENKCGGYNPALITSITGASGGSGTLEYIWQSSSSSTPPPGGSWTTISGATAATYDPPSISASTYYVRLARRAGCSSYAGISNVVKKEVQGSMKFKGTPTDPTCANGTDGKINIDIESVMFPNYSFNWTSAAGGSGSGSNITTEPFNITGLSAGTYYVTITNGIGCTATSTVYLKQPTAMTFTTTTTSVSTCGGTNGKITVNITKEIVPNFSYNWTKTGGGSGSGSGITTEPFSITGLTAGTYNLTITNGEGCTATGTATVSEPGAPTGSITGTTTICAGASTTLTASGGSTYLWSNGATTAAITVSPNTTTTYTVTVTAANNCTDTDSKVVTVNPAPAGAITGNLALCTGQSTTLTATGGGTYAWNTGATSASITVTPSASTNYTVTVTGANGCTDTDTKTVTVNGLPAASISGNSPICNGQSTTLTASGGTSYTWSNGATTAAITVSPSTTTTYTVTVTNANNCTATATKVVTVNPAPSASISGTSTICNGQSTTLTAAGGGTYVWSNNATTAAISVTPTITTTYTVTVTGANGCTATATKTVTVNSLPSASISGNTTVCTGSSTTLTASGGGTYVWNTGATTAAVTVTPSTTTTYTVTVTNAAGCTVTSTKTVTVSSVANAAISGAETVCSGSSVTLTASGGNTYVWSTGATTAAISVSPSTLTTYTVTVTAAGGCTEVVKRAVLPYSCGSVCSSRTANSTIECNSGVDYGFYAGQLIGSGAIYFPISSATFVEYTDGTAYYSGVATDPSSGAQFNFDFAFTGRTITAPAGSPKTPYCGNYTFDPTDLYYYPSYTGLITGLGNYAGAQVSFVNMMPAFQIGTGANQHQGAFGGSGWLSPTLINQPDNSNYTIAPGSQFDINVEFSGSSCIACLNLPPTATINGNGNICNGQSTTLTATGGGTYAWSNGATTAAITVSPTVTTTYTVTVTGALGCTAVATKVVTLGTPPAAAITGNTTICNGTSTTLTASGGGTYVWSNGATSAAITVTPSTTTTYTVTVTSASSGCTATANKTVTVNSLPTASISGTTTICNGSSTVLTATGGGTYLWSNAATTAAITVTPAATTTYTVTVTNANGCTVTSTKTVTVNSLPSASISGANSICFGANTVFTATGGGTYLWSTSATTAAITVSTAGTYTVTVTNAQGCTASATRTLTIAPNLVVASSQVNVLCFGASTGSIDLTVTGGTAPYTYNWGAGQPTTQDRSGLAAGTYTVTVTDAGGCTKTASATITEPSAVVLSVTASNATCGNANGSIDLTVSGGVAPYTYNWGAGQPTTQDRSGLAAGTYTVTVTDANNCTKTISASVSNIGGPSLSATQVNVLCFGASTGSIDLTVTGGTSPYTYNWGAGQPTTQDRSGLAAGTYTVTVTDANTCSAITSVTITQPAALALSTTQVNILCNGASTGSIDLTVTGGVSPYTYNWGAGQPTTQDRSGLAAGTYTVTVTDANNCTKTTSATITQPAVLAVELGPNKSVCGYENYTQTAVVTGGVGPFTYLWSNAATTNPITVAMQGAIVTLTVTVTDVNACTATDVVVINPNFNFTNGGTIAGSLNTCGPVDPPAFTSGTLPSGGAGDGATEYIWMYSTVTCTPPSLGDPNWSPAPGVNNLVTYDPGLITQTTCYIRCARRAGCIEYLGESNVLSVSVTTPMTISASATPVTCNGGSNGKITIDVTAGATPNYSYNWNNGSTTGSGSGITTEPFDILNLSAATYTVTVTNGNNCTATATVTVTQPTVLALSTTQVNVLCNGASTGSIDLTVTGGTAPYTYNWGAGQPTTQDRSGLAAGIYNVTVTDANNCTATTTVTISQPTALALTTTQVNVLCNGAATGSIDLTVTGGVSPYTYNWGAGQPTTQDRSGLTAGTYTVTVTDANNCTKTTSVTITQPTALVVTSTQVNVLCFGASTGSIDLTVTGGVAPYTYNWGAGQPTTQDRSNLAAGTYNVTVSDANNCTATTSVTITQPTVLALSTTQVNVLCFGASTGSIDLTVTGGVSPYTYNWGAGQPTTQDRSGLAAGTYNVTVTDANNCTKTTSVTITQPTDIALSVSTVNSTCGNANGSIDLTVTGGVAPYTYNWGAGQPTTQDRSGLAAGTYTVTVTDANNCTKTISATVNNTGGPSLTTTQVNVLCNGASTGSIDLTVTGGTAPYTYNWGAGQPTTQDRSGLAAGTYTVTVTDANTCSAITSVTITQPAALALTTTQVNVLCNGASTGSIDLTVTGGVAPYTYNWGAGQPTTQDRSNLAAGTYNVTVTDANNCTATTSVTITQPAALALSTTQVNVLCFGASTGSVDLTVTGGVAPYTYNWGAGQPTTQDRSGLAAGTYSVTVTDANNCTKTTSVTITQPTDIALSVSTVNSTCGNANGLIDLTVNGGVAPYTYNWGAGQPTTQDRNGLLAGTYTVTVTDANNCTKTISATVNNTGGPSLSTTQVNVLCNGASTGSIDLTVTGGTAPYTYNWGAGQPTTQDRSGLAAGTYTVTVTDANSCSAVTSVTITQPAALVLSTINTNVTCFQGANGAIDLAITGGVAPYTYDWQDLSGTNNVQDRTGLTAGTYTVTVSDANACTKVTTVTLTQPTEISLAFSVVNLSCFGGSNGAIDLSVFGGTPGYTYLWSTGATTQDIANLVSTVYTVTVTDANACTKAVSILLTQPPQIALSTTVTNVSCFNGNNGAVTLSASGGTGILSYLWSNGATSQNLTNVVAGTYTVTVTDANSCTKTTSATVTQPTALVVNTTATNVSCNGGNNGTVTLTVSGGTPGYTYLWSNGATTQNINTLTAATYTVTVTDANNCTKTSVATVTEPAALAITKTQVNVLCFSGNNGSIDINVTGGVAPYTYVWSTTATTQDVSNLIAGTYTVTVTDANNCTKTTAATITEPTLLVLSAVPTPTLCNGANNGAIDLSVSGGTPAYTYLWTTGATTQDVTGLAAGTYTVTVTDANNCTKTISAIVIQPTTVVLSATTTPVSCFGGSNGTVDLSVSGGTTPYTYVWSNGATTQDLNSLVANTYTVTVTDANGCIKTTTATVTQPTDISLSTIVTNVSCFGGSNGAIDLNVSGGTPGYTYVWSTGATTQDVANLVAGSYTVTVKDANNCTKTISATITQPNALTSSTVVTNVLCFGSNNGAIDLTVNGGTTPYTYLWSNTATTQDISVLTAGTYTVTITDAQNCTKTAVATINQPTLVVLSVTSTPAACNNASNGAVDLTVSGGTPGYTYLWSNAATTQDLSNVLAGTYTVTVTDANNCTKTIVATVAQPTTVVLSTTTVPVLCFGGNNGSIDLTVSGGTPGYTYLWSTNATTQDISNLVAGTYTVTVTDANGCSKTTVATVDQPTNLVLATTVTNVTCYEGTNGSIDLVVTGGSPAYTYLWSNGATTQDLSNRAAGTYTVTVTDSHGCTKTTSATITQPTEITFIFTVNNLSCFGGSNGTIDLTVNGGVGTYTYDWSNDGPENPDNDPQDLSGLIAGVYTVTVTDGNSCTKATGIALTQPNPVTPVVDNTTNVTCFGGNDGVINISVTGGTGSYSYDWSNDGPENPDNDGQDISGLTAGTYTVTVTDANGCTGTISATITQPPAVTLVATASPATCTGLSDGQISVDVTAGVANYSYNWTRGAASGSGSGIATEPFIIPNLLAGTYQITVTDARGCTATTSATVLQPTISVVSAIPSVCDPLTNTYSVNVSVTWANAPSTSITVTTTQGGSKTINIAQGSSGTQVVTITGLPSNGAQGVDVTAAFNATCLNTFVDAYNAPLNCTPASIGNFVWNDLDADGVQDAGEPGIPNVLVTLTGTDQLGVPVTQTTTTGANGDYLFSNLVPGTYKLTFATPAGYTPTAQDLGGDDTKDSDANISNGMTINEILTAGENNLTYDAGFYQVASIGDYVWNDVDQDGIQDGSETGIVGVPVTLNGITGTGSSITLTTTTNASGFYIFANLQPGTYNITFGTPVGGYLLSPQDQGGDDALDSDAPAGTQQTVNTALISGENDLTWDAGFYQAQPSVDLEKFVNGQDADTQPGVIILVPPGAPPTVTFTFTVTNTGNMNLSNVVVTDNIYGAVCTIPFLAQGASQTCTVTAPALLGMHTNIGTVNAQPVLPNNTPFGPPLTDTDPGNYTGVFINMDKMANKTEICAGEEVEYTLITRMLGGAPGIEIRNVSAVDNNMPGSFVCNGIYWVTCAQNGNQLCDLNGNCVLNFIDNDNNGQSDEEFKWKYSLVLNQTTINTATDMGEVWYVDPTTGVETFIGNVGNSDQVTVTVNSTLCSELGNYVWEDIDADGVQDGNEPGIAGVPVTLTGTTVDGNPVTLNTTTNATGFYLFSLLVPGTYQVTFGTPAGGYVLTGQDQGGNDAADSDAAPGTQQTIPTVLAVGESDLTWDAGFYKAASIGNFVWNDLDGDGTQDAGEPGIPGVSVLLTGTTGGGTPVSLTTTTNGVGEYLFAGLEPGTYKLTFTTPGGYTVTAQDLGGDDTKDSDVNPTTGMTINEVLTSGEQNLTYDAGYFQPASIGNFVWNDLDGDGTQDAGEPGIPGVAVTLTGTTGDGQSVTLTTTTNGVGEY